MDVSHVVSSDKEFLIFKDQDVRDIVFLDLVVKVLTPDLALLVLLVVDQIVKDDLIVRSLDLEVFVWLFRSEARNVLISYFFLPNNQKALILKNLHSFDPLRNSLELLDVLSILFRQIVYRELVDLVYLQWIKVRNLFPLFRSDFFDFNSYAESFGVKKNGHPGIIFELDAKIDDEAALFTSYEQLVCLVKELDLCDKTHWHPLRMHNIEMLIENNELEVLGARHVQMVLLAVAKSLDLTYLFLLRLFRVHKVD